MSRDSLINYIEKNTLIQNDVFDSLRFELTKIIYHYGDNFGKPREKFVSKQNSLKDTIKIFLLKLIIYFKILKDKKKLKSEPKIISNSYFNINKELKKLGYNVYNPIWNLSLHEKIIGNISLLRETNKIKKFLFRKDFNELISSDFIKLFKSYENKLREFYSKQNIIAVIFPFDTPPFENLFLKICKKLKIPSFIFLHGLPAVYTKFDNKRSDYLIVWGEEIKKFFIKTGFDSDKIFISGHPYYSQINEKELKFDLKNILILTYPLSGGKAKRLSRDRGDCILYLLKIQNVLLKLGVKSVRFRPHPAENPNWYLKILDLKFFRLDTDTLENSLKNSTLIIGPSSTVFIEAIYWGVNYVIYEPMYNNKNLRMVKLTPPFDGSYPEIPVAKNEIELISIIKNKIKVNNSAIHKFIKTPFEISFIKNLIEK